MICLRINQPEKEIDYWRAIEALGGFAWKLDHDLADGRINDPDGEISKDIISAKTFSKQLVLELKEKFGVIPPEECPVGRSEKDYPRAPSGKIYYWNWYDKIKSIVREIDHELTICSACPFCNHEEGRLSSYIPCKKINGMLYQLVLPYSCFMVHSKEWTLEQFYEKAFEEGGDISITRLKIKEFGLRALYDPKTQTIVI